MLTFFVPYTDEEGNVVVDNWLIAKRYIRGFFILDIISIIPYDMLSQSRYDPIGKLALLRAFRIFRLMKLFQRLRASRILNRIRNRLGLTNASEALIRFLLAFLFTVHWSACIWYIAATSHDVTLEVRCFVVTTGGRRRRHRHRCLLTV